MIGLKSGYYLWLKIGPRHIMSEPCKMNQRAHYVIYGNKHRQKTFEITYCQAQFQVAVECQLTTPPTQHVYSQPFELASECYRIPA